ncbi:MAG: hydroxyacid dehydrogenase [bacterium]|nr:hydroxyacid dehydrogenase [bacterium]
MKVSFFTIKPWEKEYLENKLRGSKLEIKPEYFKEKLDQDHLPKNKDAEIISVFVDSEVNKEVIHAFPKLKLIAARSTGYDHIDLKEAAKRKISVTYVPDYGENTVAEFTFALILALSRKILKAHEQIRKTGSFSQENLQGFDLKGRTIGVVGAGRIGKNTIRIANGFGMNVIAYDVYPEKKLEKLMHFKFVPFKELLKVSDIVTLHVPYIKATHHLINHDSLKLMKKGAYLINTARGQVVETEALVKALKDGHLGGAGLDVLEEENVTCDELQFVLGGHPEEHNLKTVLANHVLIDMPNVVITPHNAFNTKEALQRILDTTLENIQDFITGAPKNLVK